MQPRGVSGLVPSVGFVLALLALAPGCNKVTVEQIETWKGTEKGPSKLLAALANDGVEPGLRAAAAKALGEIGKGDEVASTIAALAPGARAPLVTALLALHVAGLDDPDAGKAAEARDGLFSIRDFATEAERQQIDKHLLGALTKQLTATGKLAGSHSLEKIVGALGAAAAPTLAELLKSPKVNHTEIAGLLDKVAGVPERDAASTNLVAMAKGNPKLLDTLWAALGQLGGPSAVAFLQEKTGARNTDDAIRAAQALQLHPHPEVLEFALRFAADPKANGNLREEMFGLLETCCGAAAQDGLEKVIGSASEEIVRYRAYEAALVVGKAAAIRPALEAYAPGATYKKEDIVDYLVKDIAKLAAVKAQTEAVHQALIDLLGSPSPLARLAAILALESLGGPADAKALSRLAGDKAQVKGAGEPVGKQAARVAAALGKAR